LEEQKQAFHEKLVLLFFQAERVSIAGAFGRRKAAGPRMIFSSSRGTPDWLLQKKKQYHGCFFFS
jgi:hypothetical protein